MPDFLTSRAPWDPRLMMRIQSAWSRVGLKDGKRVEWLLAPVPYAAVPGPKNWSLGARCINCARHADHPAVKGRGSVVKKKSSKSVGKVVKSS